MDASTAGIVALSASEAVVKSYAGVQQGKLERAQIGLETAAADTAAAREANINASNFRSAIASQVAMAGQRGGASLARQFTTESYSNFLRDQEAFQRGMRLREISASNRIAQSQLKQTAGILTGATQSLASGIDAFNLSKPKGS